jgi:hypothetical protein
MNATKKKIAVKQSIRNEKKKKIRHAIKDSIDEIEDYVLCHSEDEVNRYIVFVSFNSDLDISVMGKVLKSDTYRGRSDEEYIELQCRNMYDYIDIYRVVNGSAEEHLELAKFSCALEEDIMAEVKDKLKEVK